MDKTQILGYSIHTSLKQLDNVSEKTMVNTINPHCYCEAKKDDYYKEALLKSDILIPDGIGIVIGVKILNSEKIDRIAGADLHEYLLKVFNEKKSKVFYMGSSPHNLQKIEERVKKEYPKIIVGSYSPPYKPKFSDDDNNRIVNTINDFHPDVVFIGMTAPKQEKWAYQHKDQLNTKIIASIGAVFDFYAGTVKRPGKFWQKAGFEWLPRLLREPKRLWCRTIVSTPCFLWDVLKAKMAHRF